MTNDEIDDTVSFTLKAIMLHNLDISNEMSINELSSFVDLPISIVEQSLERLQNRNIYISNEDLFNV